MTETVLSTMQQLQDMDEWAVGWPFGPGCLPAEQATVVTGWRTFRRFIEEVEQSLSDTRDVVHRLRLLADPMSSRLPVGDLLDSDIDGRTRLPLTIADASRPTLSGLYRTRFVDLEPDHAGRPGLVDVSRVLLRLDAKLTGATALGELYGGPAAFGWAGLLAEAWLAYNERRRAARAGAVAAGLSWTESADDLDRPLRWTDDAIAEVCPVERLFGAMDGVAVAAAWRPGDQVSTRLGEYYDIDRADALPLTAFHYGNRARLFVIASGEGIPHRATDAGVVLTNADGLRDTVSTEIARLAIWPGLAALARDSHPWRAWQEIRDDLSSAWGVAARRQLAERFVDFLKDALPVDGARVGSWPRARRALAAYGGFGLRYGDSDAAGRFGGKVRLDPVTPAYPITLLQQHLNDLGFPVNDVGGVYAESTEAAVRAFQLAASGMRVRALRGGTATERDTPVRFFGPVTGVMDDETALCLDAWLNPAAHGVPNVDRFGAVLLSGRSPASVLDLATTQLFTWPALMAARPALTDQQWREVGDRQRALYRRRLLARSRFADEPEAMRTSSHVIEPHFVLNTADLTNVFQLEAVTEFYANYDDPWLPLSTARADGANVPLAPDSVSARPFQRVDFLDPSGAAATRVAGTTRRLRLDGGANLSRVWASDAATPDNGHRDLMEVAAAGGRQWFKITAIDVANRIVTLDADPMLTQPSTAWRIRLRPRLVVIDPAGWRPDLLGDDATLAGSDPVGARRLRVGPDVDLTTININFDTVYLASDTARAGRTYRIVGCDPAQGTFTLDAAPKLDGNRTAWHAPAGLGGRYDPAVQNFKRSSFGTDHYQGVMSIVYDGQVHGTFSWTSLTSVRYAPDNENRSSVRGNTEYESVSWRSSETWRNYSLTVVTHGLGDDTRRARFYFDGVANPPGPGAGWAAPPETLTVDNDADGKTHVRLHDGHTNTEGDPMSGTGSAGCLVSPNHHALRGRLVTLYQQERVLLGDGLDADLTTLGACVTRDPAKALYDNAATPVGAWHLRYAAKTWVIRPEERPRNRADEP